MSLSGSGYDWAVSPLSRILTVLYLIIGAPIMYLYLSTTGSLFARAIHFAIFQLSCRKRRRPAGAAGRSAAASRGTIRRSQSAMAVAKDKHCRSLSSDKLAMTPLSSGGSSRRSTWQTKGGAGLGSGGSQQSIVGTPSVVIANGSINTLNSLTDEDLQRPKIAIPIFSCLILLFCYILCGAALLADTQTWTFSEGFYFCFVSLFTVGFGGLRPEDPNLWPCVLYIFFGLALLSTCVHILQEDVFGRIRRYRILKMRHRTLLDSFENQMGSSNSKSGGRAATSS